MRTFYIVADMEKVRPEIVHRNEGRGAMVLEFDNFISQVVKPKTTVGTFESISIRKDIPLHVLKNLAYEVDGIELYS